MEDICMDDGPSRLKKWKSKFFLIDHRAIPDHLTRIHSHSCVSDDLPADGYNQNDVKRLRVHLICLREMKEEVLICSGLSSVWSNKECDLMSIYDFMTLLSWGDAKIDALILLPTLNEVAAAQPDPHLARKSKGPSQVRVQSASATASEPSQPSKKRRLKKRASEAGYSAPELGQAKGLNEADITDFCTELEDNMERDEGTSIRTDSVPTPPLSKRLGPPPSMAIASVSGPPLVGTSAHASTSVVGEYDEIPKDDFGTATRGEEIELTLFPLAPGPYHMSYPYEDVCRKAFDRTITPAELRRTESLLPLKLSNRVNVLSALLVSHGMKFRSRYTDLVASRVRLQEKLDRKTGYVKVLRLKVTSLDDKLNKGYKDVVDELRKEVTQFIGAGVEGLVRRLLSSDEFHAALAHVASI
ncbi:hypothetical protein Tco_1382721, partial [Tanacetum coccineum]